MRTIGVVTGSRADYGILLPLLRAIQKDPSLTLRLMVTGMHLSPEFGLTVKEIERDGFSIAERVETLLSSDTPEGIAKSMGLGTIGFAQTFARGRPDMLVVLGDRFEVHAAALAALPFKIPVAHIHGGELTEGAFDNSLRHSITQMSHLHFVATEEYGQRLIQMGEESWRITVSGALSLDNLRSMVFLSREELQAMLGLSLERRPLVVTFHPATLEYEHSEFYIEELLKALRQFDLPLIFTASNADTNGRLITERIREFVHMHSCACLRENLGTRAYFSVMAIAVAMVGNSSSGIVEAASFGLPVVNIGNRQRGRIRPGNVIDVENDHAAVIRGIETALSAEFSAGLKGMENPYGKGHAAEIIVQRLRDLPLESPLIVKRFGSLPVSV